MLRDEKFLKKAAVKPDALKIGMPLFFSLLLAFDQNL
jgi:hypothetical protein